MLIGRQPTNETMGITRHACLCAVLRRLTSKRVAGFLFGVLLVEGFVYVLTNDAFPGLVKIGMTTHDPRKRAGELYTTGVPFPFDVAFCIWCDDAALVEEAVHCRLDDFRCNKSREFFKVDTRSAVGIVATFAMVKYSLFAVPRSHVIPSELFKATNVAGMPESEVRDLLPYIVNAATRNVMDAAKSHYIEDRYENTAGLEDE